MASRPALMGNIVANSLQARVCCRSLEVPQYLLAGSAVAREGISILSWTTRTCLAIRPASLCSVVSSSMMPAPRASASVAALQAMSHLHSCLGCLGQQGRFGPSGQHMRATSWLFRVWPSRLEILHPCCAWSAVVRRVMPALSWTIRSFLAIWQA